MMHPGTMPPNKEEQGEGQPRQQSSENRKGEERVEGVEGGRGERTDRLTNTIKFGVLWRRFRVL